MPLNNSIRRVYPGMGSPGPSFSLADQAAASGASTLVCTMPQPISHGVVRVKTEAAVTSFLLVAVLGKTTVSTVAGAPPLTTPDTIVLYHGDVATAIPGVTSAFVDEFIDFNADRPMSEIDILITAGAATTISYEVIGGS